MLDDESTQMYGSYWLTNGTYTGIFVIVNNSTTNVTITINNIVQNMNYTDDVEFEDENASLWALLLEGVYNNTLGMVVLMPSNLTYWVSVGPITTNMSVNVENTNDNENSANAESNSSVSIIVYISSVLAEHWVGFLITICVVVGVLLLYGIYYRTTLPRKER